MVRFAGFLVPVFCCSCFTDPALSAESSGSTSGSTGSPGSSSASGDVESSGAVVEVSTGPASDTTSWGSDEGGDTSGGFDTTGSDTAEDETGSSGSGGDLAPCRGASRALYVAFDGVTLVPGRQPSASAGTVYADSVFEGEWAAYRDPDREQIFERVQELFAPFDVCVTDQRPDESVPFDMVVYTGQDVHGSVGFPPAVDCGDSNGADSISLLSGPALAFYATELRGNTIAWSVAHSYGLGPADAIGDLMVSNPINSGLDAEFTEACGNALLSNPCPATPGCAPGQQASRTALVNVLGESVAP